MLALGKLLELTLSGHEPAEKTQVTAKGVRLRWRAEGALEVCPAEPADCGLDLVLSAGIHGHETAPIELLERLLHGIASGTLIPRVRVLFLFGNPAAIRRGKPFIEQDANRLFNGRHAQSSGLEALRVAELEQIARGFFSIPGRSRLHYDLHTTVRDSVFERFAVYPYQAGRAHSRRELARLAAAGVQAVLLQDKPSATFSAFTYEQLGAEAFTLELGQVHVPAPRQAAIVDAWYVWHRSDPAATRRLAGRRATLQGRSRNRQVQRQLSPACTGRYRTLHRAQSGLAAGRRPGRNTVGGERRGRAYPVSRSQGTQRLDCRASGRTGCRTAAGAMRERTAGTAVVRTASKGSDSVVAAAWKAQFDAQRILGEG